MGWKLILVSALRPAAWNYKVTDGIDETKAKLREAIRTRGQIVNLIVRQIPGTDTFEVVNGNHRLEVLQELGSADAMCFDLGAETPDHVARMVALETNGLEIEADPLKLGHVVKAIAEAVPVDEMLRTLPFTATEVKAFVERATAFSWDNLNGGEPTTDDVDAEKGPRRNRTLIVLDLPRDLAQRFKEQVKRFPTDAEAVQRCVEFLASIEIPDA